MSWMPRIGAEFAGYRLDALLGHGGMSIVYRAEHVVLGRMVALKLLSPQLGEDDSFRERFTRESRLAASLDHPNVIPIYEAAESEGVFFIAMRYVEGADLRTLLKQGPLEPARLISIIDQTANGLAAAHARGLIHRDVKPANILVDPGEARGEPDHVYLSDFGVAKQMSVPSMTKTGIFVGTAEYASPEQIEGKQLDPRADVYSLGCVLYECLTGTSVYDKDSEVALMYAHLLEPPPSVSERRPDLPLELDEVVGKAMAKSRDERYGSAKELAAALRDVLAGAPTAGVPPARAAPPTVLAPGVRPGAAAPAGAAGSQVAALGHAGGEAEAPAAGKPAPPPTKAGGRAGRGWPRPVLVAVGLATAAVIGLAVALAVVLTGGGSSKKGASAGVSVTRAAPVKRQRGAIAPVADSLLAVLVPSEIAHDCTTLGTRSPGAVETDRCAPPANAPTDFPDDLQLDFYPNAEALEAGWEQREKGLTPVRCGTTAGERSWFHSTGKRGGRRECFIDAKSQFIILWTHEKLGSDDHVDMLGTAMEPGRAPTTFRSWWNAANDSIGKCRPKAAEDVCLATIQKLAR